MPYVFRIHQQTGDGSSLGNFDNGWNESAPLRGSVLNEIETGLEKGRMGTSIPSIFARPLLFEAAFNNIGNKLDGNGLNQQLVSEVFDMLEFLYQNGRSNKLVTEEWDSETQLKKMRDSDSDAIRRLGLAIENHLGKIKNPDKITLFFWEDVTNFGEKVKVLIGGTSLTTMVFTSPNWARKAENNGWVFKRVDGSKFFANDVRPLYLRAKDFRDMMYCMRRSFNAQFDLQCGINTGLARYLEDSIARSSATPQVLTPVEFTNQYPPIKGVRAGQLPISYKEVSANAAGSGYLIRPTSRRYTTGKTDTAGGALNIRVPMALNEKGLSGVKYVGGAPWKASYKIDEAIVRNPGIPYYKRELPGDMGIEYPYLTAFDLLEDKIIKVPGIIDSQKFHTLFDGQSTYLLPLKKLFFEFFDISDLDKPHAHTGKKLVVINSANNEITVTINMPIEDAVTPYIELKRTYRGNDIVKSGQDEVKDIEIGFFPFYKVTDNEDLNVYSVMLASAANDKLVFNKITNDEIEDLPAVYTSRTAETQYLHNTKYYDVSGTIDLVEVVLPSGVKALVIPRMKELKTGATDFQFAIDFGTSNTFIAYKINGITGVHTLSFDENDRQVEFLYSPDKLPMMADTIQREFMLPTIGAEDSIAEFPIKTSVSEVYNLRDKALEPGGLKLFGHLNVGFKFKNEINVQGLAGTTYCTDLKWALEEEPGGPVQRGRVKAFCKQILWLVKNKALLNGGNDEFTVMLTFPISMIDKTVFLHTMGHTGSWYDAANELGLNKIHFNDEITESEAPYYKVVTDKVNMLNIDIGGGTTDIFLVRHLDKDGNALPISAKYSSVKFAADDLWGDGTTAHTEAIGNNGFYLYLKKKIEENHGSNALDVYIKMVNKSADIIAQLFSNDSRFNTSALISHNQNLKSILLIHYSALLFAIGRMLKKLDVGIPSVISFTGMGSKYLALICSDESRLAKFTAEVLKLVTDFNVPHMFKLKQHYADAKEVTAKGVLEKESVHPNYRIPSDRKEKYIDTGCDHFSRLIYNQLFTESETNDIRRDARLMFDKFMEMLRSDEFSQFTADTFELSIPENMLDELDRVADGSYNNVQGSLNRGHRNRGVQDNLFFWFLKDSLNKLSVAFYDK